MEWSNSGKFTYNTEEAKKYLNCQWPRAAAGWKVSGRRETFKTFCGGREKMVHDLWHRPAAHKLCLPRKLSPPWFTLDLTAPITFLIIHIRSCTRSLQYFSLFGERAQFSEFSLLFSIPLIYHKLFSTFHFCCLNSFHNFSLRRRRRRRRLDDDDYDDV